LNHITVGVHYGIHEKLHTVGMIVPSIMLPLFYQAFKQI